ncbi:Transmembrane protein ENSP00000340100 like protein [Myotis brandtii]|uniref:Transmembrane protein ENSP00000340100 like protein n=1 Tax=Myotis brandtii TaxID=109478 RepID=S7NMQ1_MYOBR|nr:Transmembrane protein ENSP00000340100 like protein [Myotis brandtii]
MALEIKQLLASESTPISPTSSRRSQGSSCLDILSLSNLSFGPSQSSQHSRELSVPPVTPSMTQLKDHKSLTQSAPQSTGAISIQDYWADHQLRQEFQAPDVFWDARDPSSSSLEECRIPVNQQNKKSNTEYVSEKQVTPCKGTHAGAAQGDQRQHLVRFVAAGQDLSVFGVLVPDPRKGLLLPPHRGLLFGAPGVMGGQPVHPDFLGFWRIHYGSRANITASKSQTP